MPIGFRNINELWACIFTETLQRLGLNCAAICPGSRSTPLAVAFAQCRNIEVIPILDERSAAFFALGRAKASGLPVAVICTSGTAGANFYSAVVEANYSRVPLLLLTADRPQELRNCHSGQTIDQLKLFGNYPNWQAELAIPDPTMEMLAYLRQTTIYAFEQTLYPVSGAVHLNIPFRDPLAPIKDDSDVNAAFLESLKSSFNSEDFFAAVTDKYQLPINHSQIPIPQEWLKTKRGIIIAGVDRSQQPQKYCSAIAQLAQKLKFPVLAEGLSPVRNYASLNKNIISTYDSILRNQDLGTQLNPEVVIQIGEMPTSKVLRKWLSNNNSLRWIIEPSNQNLDALHGRVVHLRINIEDIGWEEGEGRGGEGGTRRQGDDQRINSYLNIWLDAEAQVRKKIDTALAEKTELFEGKAAWLLSQVLPPQTPLFIANSMMVRDVEFFWKPNNLGIKPFFNRGANGIDGTLSTALGIAHRQHSVMLTGDLALLHDTNGFLIGNKFIGHLTIVLINNNGGGIFEMLPISEFEPPFEELFATPQDIDFAQLCQTYRVKHELITSWEELSNKLNPLPNTGIRVLEIRTNRKESAKWRKENLGKL